MMHRQETVECLKKFNARRKLKVGTGQPPSSRPHVPAGRRLEVGVSVGPGEEEEEGEAPQVCARSHVQIRGFQMP